MEEGMEKGTWMVNFYYNFDDVYQYTAHWLLLYEGIMMQLPSTIVDFYLLYDGSVNMQI